MPQPVVELNEDAEIGMIAYGTTDACIVEGRDILDKKGVDTSYLRIRALPLSDATREFIENHDRVYVVENNQDAQMAQIIRMEYPDLATKIIPMAYLDGMPLTARWMTETLLEKEEER